MAFKGKASLQLLSFVLLYFVIIFCIYIVFCIYIIFCIVFFPLNFEKILLPVTRPLFLPLNIKKHSLNHQIAVRRNFAKLTGKQVQWSSFYGKIACLDIHCRSFLIIILKLFWITIRYSTPTCERLLLNIYLPSYFHIFPDFSCNIIAIITFDKLLLIVTKKKNI